MAAIMSAEVQKPLAPLVIGRLLELGVSGWRAQVGESVLRNKSPLLVVLLSRHGFLRKPHRSYLLLVLQRLNRVDTGGAPSGCQDGECDHPREKRGANQ